MITPQRGKEMLGAYFSRDLSSWVGKTVAKEDKVTAKATNQISATQLAIRIAGGGFIASVAGAVVFPMAKDFIDGVMAGLKGDEGPENKAAVEQTKDLKDSTIQQAAPPKPAPEPPKPQVPPTPPEVKTPEAEKKVEKQTEKATEAAKKQPEEAPVAKPVAKPVEVPKAETKPLEVKPKEPETAAYSAGKMLGTGARKTGQAVEEKRQVAIATTVTVAETARDTGKKMLGTLSEKYESGGKGPGVVGYDTTGGTSYGTYQIESKKGTMAAFLKFIQPAHPDWVSKLQESGPANTGNTKGPFVDTWKAIAKEDPKGFASAQHDFIQARLYDPAAKGLKKTLNFDVDTMSQAMRDVLWSTAVQHGPTGAIAVFKWAITQAGVGADESKIIQLVYQKRATQFGSSTLAVQESVRKRFVDEQKQAQTWLAQEKGNAGASTVAFTTPAQISKQPGVQVASADTTRAPQSGFTGPAPKNEPNYAKTKNGELINIAKAA